MKQQLLQTASVNNDSLNQMNPTNRTEKRHNKHAGKKRNRQQQEANEEEKEPDFPFQVIENKGLRFITPYFYKFETFVKGRWENRTIFEIFTQEFGTYYSKEYLWNAIQANKFIVIPKKPNLQQQSSSLNSITSTTLDYYEKLKLKKHDKIIHIPHRHELPILLASSSTVAAGSTDPLGSCGIKIIHEDEKDFIIVEKGHSIPVHPTGRYQKNTLVEIMALHGYPNLHLVHRIDRVTSGITILAKNASFAKKFTEWMKQKKIQKCYIARVHGKFELNKVVTISSVIQKEQDDASATSTSAQQQSASSPTTTNFYQWKAVKVELPSGSDISDDVPTTQFYGVEYDEKSNSSLVLCKPVSGKTHQIRVHLQSMGHPIVNDYQHSHTSCTNEANEDASSENSASILVVGDNVNEMSPALEGLVPLPNELYDEKYLDDICPECIKMKQQIRENKRYYVDTKKLYICLHAWTYSFPQEALSQESNSRYMFQTLSLPSWCTDVFQVHAITKARDCLLIK